MTTTGLSGAHRTDLRIEVLVGYRIGEHARAFGVAMYELVGLSGDDDPDSAGLSLGGDFRDDALSLVATALYRRSFNDPEAIDGVGVIATAGYELVPGLTAGASAGYVYILETERPGGAIVSGAGITAGLTLQYVARVR